MKKPRLVQNKKKPSRKVVIKLDRKPKTRIPIPRPGGPMKAKKGKGSYQRKPKYPN